MVHFSDISDEQLAQFLDHTLADRENDQVLDSIQSPEDMEVVGLAYAAKGIVEAGEQENDMPETGLPGGKTIEIPRFAPLPMCGFLGEEDENV